VGLPAGDKKQCSNSWRKGAGRHDSDCGYTYPFEIPPVVRTYTRYNFLADELTCLIISDQIAGGGWTAPTDRVTDIQLQNDEILLLKGNSAALTAVVSPGRLRTGGYLDCFCS
jgi:hypothetical protein